MAINHISPTDKDRCMSDSNGVQVQGNQSNPIVMQLFTKSHPKYLGINVHV
jgi:hypothetical protein